MADQLTREQAVEQNQKMIAEWAAECEKYGLLACFMSCVDPDKSIQIFKSAIMDDEMTVRHLRYMANNIEAKNTTKF